MKGPCRTLKVSRRRSRSTKRQYLDRLAEGEEKEGGGERSRATRNGGFTNPLVNYSTTSCDSENIKP